MCLFQVSSAVWESGFYICIIYLAMYFVGSKQLYFHTVIQPTFSEHPLQVQLWVVGGITYKDGPFGPFSQTALNLTGKVTGTFCCLIHAMMGRWAEDRAVGARGKNCLPCLWESKSPDRAGDHLARSSGMSGIWSLGNRVIFFLEEGSGICKRLVKSSSLPRSL